MAERCSSSVLQKDLQKRTSCTTSQTPERRSNPRNHAVPLLDSLVGDKTYDFLIMPLLREFNDPPFVYVEEVVDFVRQTLEVHISSSYFISFLIAFQGLGFLHEASIAHRSVSFLVYFSQQADMNVQGLLRSQYHA